MENKLCDIIKKTTGRQGEDMAADYLRSAGYVVLERNFRCNMGEVDIIARNGEYLCFVEVKTRNSVKYGMPRDAVDRKKRLRLLRSAGLYLKLHRELSFLSPRMDIVEILYKRGKAYLRHTPNAFSD